MKQLKLLFARLSLSISPVATEQSQTCARNWLCLILAILQRVRGDLLLDHKQRMENLPDDDRLIKLCSDAGFVKTVAPGQYFMTADAEEFSKINGPVARREKLWLEMTDRQDPNDGFVETRKWVLCWK